MHTSQVVFNQDHSPDDDDDDDVEWLAEGATKHYTRQYFSFSLSGIFAFYNLLFSENPL